MSLIRDDRIAETTTSTGTGVITLAGAFSAAFKAFSSVCTIGDTFYAVIEGIDVNGVPTGEWEDGLYTYSAASQITRTTVYKSSNAGAAVTFSAGTKRVYVAITAASISDGSYKFGSFAVGSILANEVLMDYEVVAACVLGINFLKSQASVGTNPTASWVGIIQRNGTGIGTLTIDTSGNPTWVLTGGSTLTLAAGDYITLLAPASPDATIARLRFSFFAGALVAAGAGGAVVVTTPTIRASNLATYSAASIAVPFPGTPVVGDIAIVHCENGQTIPTFPAGWTQLFQTAGSNYTNAITVAKVLTAGDITTGSCTIGWAGSYDGFYSCVIVTGTTMNGLRDIQGAGTAGSASFLSVSTNPSNLALSTDLVIGFAGCRGANTTIGLTNFTQLIAPVGTTNASGYVGKYTGTLGKLGLSETVSSVAANNGLEYALIMLR